MCRLLLFTSLLLKIVINYSVTQNCVPCVCDNLLANCSRHATVSILTTIKTLNSNITNVILEGQPLENINQKLFISFENIEKLNLKNCKLYFVHRDTFTSLVKLLEIDLSDNKLVSLDKNIFKFNEKLEKVYLNNNNLKIIKNYTFIKQNNLQYLYLQQNFLINVTKEAFSKYTALKLLNLTANKLKYIDVEIIDGSDNLYELYIDDNPFVCDCFLKKLYISLKRRQFFNINTKCYEPEAIKDQTFIDLSSHDFSCPINITTLNNNSIITHDNNITLSCEVGADSEPYLMWKVNDSVIYDSEKYSRSKTDLNSNTFVYNLTIYDLKSNDTGVYKCIAKNTGYLNETNYNLTIKSAVKPQILIPSENYIFVDLHEENYTIPFLVYGIPKPQIKWLFRNKTLSASEKQNTVYFNESNADGDTYWFNVTIKKVKLKYRTQFFCQVSNILGVTNKRVTLIILYPHEPVFELTNTDIQTIEMKNITLICGVKAVPKPDIIWSYGHLKIDSKLSPKKYMVKEYRDQIGSYWSKLTIFKIELYESGIYRCEANNSENVETKLFTIKVAAKTEICEDTWKSTILIVIGVLLLIVLLILIILKCCIRYYVSKNWSTEYFYKEPVLE